jgi:hypothetical protein
MISAGSGPFLWKAFNRDGDGRGALIVEFKTEVPGNYTLVDHALARIERGLIGILHVEGAQAPDRLGPHRTVVAGTGLVHVEQALANRLLPEALLCAVFSWGLGPRGRFVHPPRLIFLIQINISSADWCSRRCKSLLREEALMDTKLRSNPAFELLRLFSEIGKAFWRKRAALNELADCGASWACQSLGENSVGMGWQAGWG